MFLLLKHKAADPGETRVWADGKTRKKVGKKWIVISSGKSPERQMADTWRKGQEYFDYAMTTNLGYLVEQTLQEHGIASYDDLVDAIKKGPQDTAHTFFKTLINKVNAIQTQPKERQAVVDMFGRSLILLKDQYSSKAKEKLTITKTSKKGNEYRAYEEGKHDTSLPSIKATRIKTEKKKLGGWSVTGELTTSHIRKMLATKSAAITSGKPDSRKKWILPKKAEDMELKYKGDSLVIHVKQIVKKKERTRATAKASIKIPYAYAKGFLLNQIASTRTRNNFIFRMERSQGYQNYLERYGA